MTSITETPVRSGPLSIIVRPASVCCEALVVDGHGTFAVELAQPRQRFAVLLLEAGQGPQIVAMFDTEPDAEQAAQELCLTLPQAVQAARGGAVQ